MLNYANIANAFNLTLTKHPEGSQEYGNILIDACQMNYLRYTNISNLTLSGET